MSMIAQVRSFLIIAVVLYCWVSGVALNLLKTSLNLTEKKQT